MRTKKLAWLLCLGLLATIGPLPDALAKGSRGGSVSVKGYYRKDGTYVRPHHRSAPDGNFSNNWSTRGNTNPYTGEAGTKTAPSGSSSYRLPSPPTYPGSSSPAPWSRTVPNTFPPPAPTAAPMLLGDPQAPAVKVDAAPNEERPQAAATAQITATPTASGPVVRVGPMRRYIYAGSQHARPAPAYRLVGPERIAVEGGAARFESSAPHVLAVDGQGFLQPKGVGRATIRVCTAGSVTELSYRLAEIPVREGMLRDEVEDALGEPGATGPTWVRFRAYPDAIFWFSLGSLYRVTENPGE